MFNNGHKNIARQPSGTPLVQAPHPLIGQSSSLDVEMRNGSVKTKAEIVRTLKKFVVAEILKVPWISLLHHEFGKFIERK